MTVIHRLVGSIVLLGSGFVAVSTILPSLKVLRMPDGYDLALVGYCVMAAYAGFRMLRR
jgi:hypothetical protein